MKTKFAWKILEKGMKSSNGNHIWKKNKWYKENGELIICQKGFHASHLLIDAMIYVTPGVICKVEYKGDTIKEDDKFVCSEMRIIKTYRFTKHMAIEFSIYCAKLCLPIFEKEFPNDKRPREAIKAAKNYLDNPSKRNKSAARSAKFAAESAGYAAESAARSAGYAAGYAAGSAAEFAAWSAAEYAAESAAWSAARSAEYAARSAAKKKMNNKLLKIIE